MDYLPVTDEALKQQNIMLQATLENYRDVLICSIDRQYRCLVFNRAFAQAVSQAYGTEIKLGKSLLDCITNSDDLIKAKRSFDGALAGKAHFSLESYGELNRRYYEIRFAP